MRITTCDSFLDFMMGSYSRQSLGYLMKDKRKLPWWSDALMSVSRRSMHQRSEQISEQDRRREREHRGGDGRGGEGRRIEAGRKSNGASQTDSVTLWITWALCRLHCALGFTGASRLVTWLQSQDSITLTNINQLSIQPIARGLRIQLLTSKAYKIHNQTCQN